MSEGEVSRMVVEAVLEVVVEETGLDQSGAREARPTEGLLWCSSPL
jgi:hypothetical protein